ncbi:DNA oxidative demethylase AlkB [Pseudogulbenkiania subflava]|uniref:Alpha-ketoglutarate-dependent dioxygenase AlkB n=1 Tax=Pseudogulbenkiania subflava DSM 22618 TaxID=1123014 RepID=A0A1Y6BBL2_9NEIS|nr:DNA oxidative demethylase AlkB [Pseudogulbenkiania subflava]SMF01232.1 DNA-N1-methyladenine dioxygenase [Pseudogulbenkiania subflava DSM 22618]
MTFDLFGDEPRTWREELAPGAVVLRGFALPHVDALLAALGDVTAVAPFRQMITPGGYRMSVTMSGCGRYGWVSDHSGYRYDPLDPTSSQPWPAMPESFHLLARDAAAEAGFPGYEPDACLINRYVPGARLSLHQDKDERDQVAPIVSVSLGLPAMFLFGGLHRNDPTVRIPLAHGDVVVWGGPSRLRYHGVLPLKEGCHPLLGAERINLTFRKVR